MFHEEHGGQCPWWGVKEDGKSSKVMSARSQDELLQAWKSIIRTLAFAWNDEGGESGICEQRNDMIWLTFQRDPTGCLRRDIGEREVSWEVDTLTQEKHNAGLDQCRNGADGEMWLSSGMWQLPQEEGTENL